MIRARLRKRPGVRRNLGLDLEGETLQQISPSLPLLLDALALLQRELIEPLECTLALASVDRDGGFHHGKGPRLRNWVIAAPPPPPLRQGSSDWPLRTEVSALTTQALEEWIRR